MLAIQLQAHRWLVDETRPLGRPGGFGAVFLGHNDDGREVAVKRLEISANEAAHRELSIAQHLAGKSFQHVIPVHDSGLDPDSGRYFVVMARATESLQDKINATGPLGEVPAAHILLDILRGLAEVPDIVHRDLKPANVLLHEQRWKIADFGIARFVEESTSLRTLKDCLTPGYAAPEQWQNQRASAATDIYALGCVGYALVTKAPPFSGSPDELRHQHVEMLPPDPSGVSPRLRSALTMMLRKAPGARPTRERAIKLLEEFLADQDKAKPSPGAFSTLAHAGALEAVRQATQESEGEKRQVELARRTQLAQEGSRTFTELIEHLLTAIERDAPTATIERPGRGASGWQAILGSARLEIKNILDGSHGMEQHGWDIIMGATINVTQKKFSHYEWGASLWYARVGGDQYRWREIGYMDSPLGFGFGFGKVFQPYALKSIHEALNVMGPAMGVIQEAYTPRPIDDEDTSDFVQRWIGLFVKAYHGHLAHPRTLPLTWESLS